MTTAQIKKIRAQVNAAYNRSDMAEFDRLMSILHDEAVASAERFAKSAEGRAHLTYLMDRP